MGDRTLPCVETKARSRMAFVVTDNDVLIERLELGPFGTNAYVVVCRATGDSVLIDAPGEASKILERFTGNNPQYILLTHAHVDHLGALPELRYKLRVPLAAHPLEAATLPSPPEILLGNGDILSLGKIELKVLHTPGHTPGSLCFLTGQYLIAGDTIFPGGPGKTSSPKALREIIESITGKIFVLPDDTQVYPGHGDSTVLKKEKEEFAVFSSRSHNPQLCGDVLWLSS
jgi:glyoxylase-like metal-dependent hydrolase (beta-lactamase superfamily II)